MTKTVEEYFVDWEEHMFGFGYGTGETHVLTAIKKFFCCIKVNNGSFSYAYEILEQELGASTTWLLINMFCHADHIDYGTSPRYGWLTASGKALAAFFEVNSIEEMCEIISDPDRVTCTPEQ